MPITDDAAVYRSPRTGLVATATLTPWWTIVHVGHHRRRQRPERRLAMVARRSLPNVSISARHAASSAGARHPGGAADLRSRTRPRWSHSVDAPDRSTGCRPGRPPGARDGTSARSQATCWCCPIRSALALHDRVSVAATRPQTERCASGHVETRQRSHARQRWCPRRRIHGLGSSASVGDAWRCTAVHESSLPLPLLDRSWSWRATTVPCGTRAAPPSLHDCRLVGAPLRRCLLRGAPTSGGLLLAVAPTPPTR